MLLGGRSLKMRHLMHWYSESYITCSISHKKCTFYLFVLLCLSHRFVNLYDIYTYIDQGCFRVIEVIAWNQSVPNQNKTEHNSHSLYNSFFASYGTHVGYILFRQIKTNSHTFHERIGAETRWSPFRRRYILRCIFFNCCILMTISF